MQKMSKTKSQSGKGDRYRPVNQKKYNENYNRIFGEKKNGKTKE